jgi:metal-sulfur cluster biosynthetic enzyme
VPSPGTEHPGVSETTHDELRDLIMAALNRVQDPCSVAARRAMGLVDMGLIDRVEIGNEGAVEVFLRLTSPACYLMPYLESESVAQVSACPGVTAVAVHPDEGLDWSPARIAEHLRPASATIRVVPTRRGAEGG